ncbi:hypothetical protein AB0F52_30230 [Amycolatopsis sp. NPDC024027]|uniref:hypothetical protein n=1 Tax=Amycolatopsis sp. NPDC024027 TaxID=3154327 RepID=UPI0033F962AF
MLTRSTAHRIENAPRTPTNETRGPSSWMMNAPKTIVFGAFVTSAAADRKDLVEVGHVNGWAVAGKNREPWVSIDHLVGLLALSTLSALTGGQPSFGHPSMRGDVVLSTDADGHQAGELRTFDPYGQPLGPDGAVDAQNMPDNSPGSLDYGWRLT